MTREREASGAEREEWPMTHHAPSLRTAALADVPAIQAIAKGAYAPYVPRMGREPAPMVADFASLVAVGHVTVAEISGTVAGFVVAYPRAADEMHLENVAVAPAHHGQGIGRMLIAQVEENAARLGCTRVTLYTNAAMTENLALYPRLGYRQTHRATEDGYDRVFFEKAVLPVATDAPSR